MLKFRLLNDPGTEISFEIKRFVRGKKTNKKTHRNPTPQTLPCFLLKIFKMFVKL